MIYSRQVRSIDTTKVPSSLNTLLRQINLTQEESDREIETIKGLIDAARGEAKGQVDALAERIAAIESNIQALQNSVDRLESFWGI